MKTFDCSFDLAVFSTCVASGESSVLALCGTFVFEISNVDNFEFGRVFLKFEISSDIIFMFFFCVFSQISDYFFNLAGLFFVC